jgi:hypothetical protein
MNKEQELEYYRKKYKDEARQADGEKIYRLRGKSYKKIGYRFPKKGEYFLSGAILAAHEAYNDMSTKYIVVKELLNE